MGAASGVLAAELAAPLLLLCWLCCWPDDASDGSSSGHPRKPVIAGDGARRAGMRARLAGSAVSLHLPGPSGSPRLPAHRSHEDLPSARHHSAPGVIHEVLHRRDWDHSSRDLYIPLRPPALAAPPSPPSPPSPHSHPAPPAGSPPRCKKHHSNIKCSRKEQRPAAERDRESPSSFYIGDDGVEDKPFCPGKEEKQSLNESIRCAQPRPASPPRPPALRPLAGLLTPLEALDGLLTPLGGLDGLLTPLGALDGLLTPLGALDGLRGPGESASLADGADGADRSGAVHRALGSGAAAMGYARVATDSPVSVGAAGARWPAAARARHASDGDILARAPRPESGAFSESDVEPELQPPPGARAARGRPARETAI